MTEREIPKRGILKFLGILNEFKLRNSKILKNSRIPKANSRIPSQKSLGNLEFPSFVSSPSLTGGSLYRILV